MTILVTFADCDDLNTHINGSVNEVIEHYRQNNFFTREPAIKVASIAFPELGLVHEYKNAAQ